MAPEGFVAADAYVVVDDIATPVQGRSAAVKLDRPRMVRGVSMSTGRGIGPLASSANSTYRRASRT